MTGGWAPVELNKNLLNKATLLRQGDGGDVLEHRNTLRVRQNEETKEYVLNQTNSRKRTKQYGDKQSTR